MRYLKNDRLYCFSPPVMIATFLIEMIGAIYVVFRYKMTSITRLVTALLIGLAVFQLAEYNVCEGAWGVSSLMWARIGYVAITLLPPLGLHLATKIAGQPRLKLVVGAYGVAAAFAIFFMFIGHGMQSEQCLGNYVIFTTARWAVPFYALYYYGLLILTAMYSINVYAKVKKATIQKALFWLVAGYAAFVIPTTAVNLVDPSTLAGIPSIMCGFAVILAILLVTMVLPSYHKGNERISSHLRRKATRR